MLHMAHPIDTSDPLLMSDDERTAFLTRIPFVNTPDDDLPPARERYPMAVRNEARKRLNAMAETEEAA